MTYPEPDKYDDLRKVCAGLLLFAALCVVGYYFGLSLQYVVLTW